MNKGDWYYFRSFSNQLGDMVDAFLFTEEVDLDTDQVAESITGRLHELRGDVLNWVRSQECDD